MLRSFSNIYKIILIHCIIVMFITATEDICRVKKINEIKMSCELTVMKWERSLLDYQIKARMAQYYRMHNSANTFSPRVCNN